LCFIRDFRDDNGWKLVILGFSLWGWFVDIVIFNSLRGIVSKSDELFHDPSLTTSGIMFSAVDTFFTLADISFSFCDLELAIEELFSTRTNPARRGQGIFLDNLLDNSLSGRGFGECYSRSGTRWAQNGRRGREDATWCACEKLSFAPGDFGLTNGNSALAGNKRMVSLWVKKTQDAPRVRTSAR
jgi:hypothetical protein